MVALPARSAAAAIVLVFLVPVASACTVPAPPPTGSNYHWVFETERGRLAIDTGVDTSAGQPRHVCVSASSTTYGPGPGPPSPTVRGGRIVEKVLRTHAPNSSPDSRLVTVEWYDVQTGRAYSWNTRESDLSSGIWWDGAGAGWILHVRHDGILVVDLDAGTHKVVRPDAPAGNLKLFRPVAGLEPVLLLDYWDPGRHGSGLYDAQREQWVLPDHAVPVPEMVDAVSARGLWIVYAEHRVNGSQREAVRFWGYDGDGRTAEPTPWLPPGHELVTHPAPPLIVLRNETGSQVEYDFGTETLRPSTWQPPAPAKGPTFQVTSGAPGLRDPGWAWVTLEPWTSASPSASPTTPPEGTTTESAGPPAAAAAAILAAVMALLLAAAARRRLPP